MFLARCLVYSFSLCSLAMAASTSNDASFFKNSAHIKSSTIENQSMHVAPKIDLSGTWQASKDCPRFVKKDQFLHLEQNEESIKVDEDITIPFGKVFSEDEDENDSWRFIIFSFWNKTGKTLFVNTFDIDISPDENNPILSSFAFSIKNDELHVKIKEQTYSPNFNKIPREYPDCVLSRQ
jgi:hypothetical protein